MQVLRNVWLASAQAAWACTHPCCASRAARACTHPSGAHRAGGRARGAHSLRRARRQRRGGAVRAFAALPPCSNPSWPATRRRSAARPARRRSGAACCSRCSPQRARAPRARRQARHGALWSPLCLLAGRRGERGAWSRHRRADGRVCKRQGGLQVAAARRVGADQQGRCAARRRRPLLPHATHCVLSALRWQARTSCLWAAARRSASRSAPLGSGAWSSLARRSLWATS